MRKFYILVIAIWTIVLPFYIKAQVTVAQNQGGSTDYVGWNNAQAFPLNIRHEGNQPINFSTDNLLRMKLNHTLNYVVNNGTSLSRNGYLLLGQNSPIVTQGNTPIYNIGAFSLLHLNGDQSTLAGGIDGLGHRAWMKTGITFIGNGDLSYIGLRTAADDVTETTIAWADDGGGTAGPDDMVFRYLGGADADVAISSDLNDPSDGDGLHIARFIPSGLIGFGNTFNATTRPQNLLHMSLNGNRATFLQLTNESGTGQTATDGLHIGYDANNLEAQIIQRENANLTLFNGSVVPRFTIAPNGNVGAGSVFTPAAQPQNLFHVNNTANNASFVQITNESGTGQTATDGLRIGLPATGSSNLEAQINQRGNDRLSLYTHNGERMRIMHIGALKS